MLIQPVQSPARYPTVSSPPGAEATEQLTDVYLGKTTVYATDDAGRVVVRGGNAGHSQSERPGWTVLKNMFFPVDMQQSVSSDYLATRGWICARDLVHGVGGFVVGAAVFAALGLDPIWGGAGMQTYNMIRDRACQAVGFAASFHVDKAIKNPRAWIVGGEAIGNLGAVIQACGALPAVTSNVPGGLLTVTLAAFAISTIAGVMSGAASASIGPRQAIADNLGELQVKNGNQGTVVSLVGGLLGLKLVGPVLAAGGAWIPLVAAATGILESLASFQFVKHLDYHPVNEAGLRRIVNAGEIVGPESDNFLKMMGSLKSRDRYPLGRPGRPLLDDPGRWAELRHLYQGRQYILEMREGGPYVVLRDGCTAEDRLQAALQAVHVERLQASPEYRALLEQQGALSGDRWLVSQSLAATPADVKPLLADLKRAGWSTDLLRFSDAGHRAQWEDPRAGSTPPLITPTLPVPEAGPLPGPARRSLLPILALGLCLAANPAPALAPDQVDSPPTTALRG